MRKLALFIAANLMVLSASAQLGYIINKVKNATRQSNSQNTSQANRTKDYVQEKQVSDLHFHCDFWSCRGYNIASQRYDSGVLDPFLKGTGAQARIATDIVNLRAQLDSIMQYVNTLQGSYNLSTRYLDALDNEVFSILNYREEYDNYVHIIECIRIDSIANSETADTITEFDKKYATFYSVQARVHNIEYMQSKKHADSITAANQKRWAKENKIEEEKQRKYLTKKYHNAATVKKLLARELWIGMTDEMVEDEYGIAPDFHKSVSASVLIESWTYSDPLMNLIFKNHKLIQITD